MSKWAYYNEIDPFAAAWLRKLIEAGHVADGEVDERDIRDVHPADLRGFAQVHMFCWHRRLVESPAPCKLGRRPARLDRILPVPTFLPGRPRRRGY